MAGKGYVLVFCLAFSLSFTLGFLADPGSSLEERLAALETRLQEVVQELEVVQGCTSDYCSIHWSAWSAWSPWSHCSSQCHHGNGKQYGVRDQSRTRTRLCLHKDPLTNQKFCNGTSSEVDIRPCNTVEFYGCMNEQNTNGTDGNYAVAYNFLDELAQSTCTAALTSAAHSAAVRRDCYHGNTADCTTICGKLNYTCYDELHVYNDPSILNSNAHAWTDEGKRGLYMYRYFSCSGSGGCGPNYCCCKW